MIFFFKLCDSSETCSDLLMQECMTILLLFHLSKIRLFGL